MTRSELIREIGELSLRGQQFKADIAQWLNRGQRVIAQRRNFSWMHSIASVVIPANTTSGDLPANFKGLAQERSPITYTAPNQSFPTPVEVRSRAELERMNPGAFGYVVNTVNSWTPYLVFLEQNNGGLWTINVPPQFPYTDTATYAVSCYLFPDDLTLGDDHNGLTDDPELAEALLNWVRAKGYQAIDPTAPQGEAAMALYEQSFQRAAYNDARRTLAGRNFRW